jgi:hypothetical protein
MTSIVAPTITKEHFRESSVTLIKPLEIKPLAPAPVQCGSPFLEIQILHTFSGSVSRTLAANAP